jgi:long-chain acyl-CoA synthetase
VLFVSLYSRAHITADRIDRQLCDSLSRYKLPIEITIIQQRPKNAVGKIEKPLLGKSIAQHHQ